MQYPCKRTHAQITHSHVCHDFVFCLVLFWQGPIWRNLRRCIPLAGHFFDFPAVPTGTWRYTIVQRALNAIKPYISAKEPYISAEGPYISAKEPYGYVALYNRSKSPEYPPHTQALYLRNKALHIRKRALLISFALLRICSPTYHKEPYICRALLRICKEPCKEPYISAKEPYISAIKPYISTKEPIYLQNTSTEEC